MLFVPSAYLLLALSSAYWAKNWHTRCEAQPLCYEQYAECMTNRPFYSNCVMPWDRMFD